MVDGEKLSYKMYCRIHIIETGSEIINTIGIETEQPAHGHGHGEAVNETISIFSELLDTDEIDTTPHVKKQDSNERDVHGNFLMSSDEFHKVIQETKANNLKAIITPWHECIDSKGKWNYSKTIGLFAKASNHYTNLQSFFETLASMPVSQASVERLFHRLKRVRSPLRNRLDLESCNMNIYLYLNKYRYMLNRKFNSQDGKDLGEENSEVEDQ
jgi:hypothetical protein